MEKGGRWQATKSALGMGVATEYPEAAKLKRAGCVAATDQFPMVTASKLSHARALHDHIDWQCHATKECRKPI
jgi:hypothetical protein